MRHWNYRVIHTDGVVGLFEVVYNENNKPTGFSKVCLIENNIAELKETLLDLVEALNKPVLHWEGTSLTEKP